MVGRAPTQFVISPMDRLDYCGDGTSDKHRFYNRTNSDNITVFGKDIYKLKLCIGINI